LGRTIVASLTTSVADIAMVALPEDKRNEPSGLINGL
jgi:hypothetical protein